jgi:hypothetical protein
LQDYSSTTTGSPTEYKMMAVTTSFTYLTETGATQHNGISFAKIGLNNKVIEVHSVVNEVST